MVQINGMESSRRDRQREHFYRRFDAIPPRQTSHPRGGRDEAGGSAFVEWNTTLGVYECRGGVVGEWIENPDLSYGVMKYVEVQACL